MQRNYTQLFLQLFAATVGKNQYEASIRSTKSLIGSRQRLLRAVDVKFGYLDTLLWVPTFPAVDTLRRYVTPKYFPNDKELEIAYLITDKPAALIAFCVLYV